MPLQPAFLAYLSSNLLNVTGDNDYTVVFDTEVYDQNADYNTGTGTFTAPVTGKYLFSGCIVLFGMTSANRAEAHVSTSNRIFGGGKANPIAIASVSGYSGFPQTALADMDAGDTATFFITCTGEGVGVNTADIFGTAVPQTYFCGHLSC
jgi:hypothetical protein